MSTWNELKPVRIGGKTVLRPADQVQVTPASLDPPPETSGARYVAELKARKGAGQVWCWWLHNRLDHRRPAALTQDDIAADAARHAATQEDV